MSAKILSWPKPGPEADLEWFAGRVRRAIDAGNAGSAYMLTVALVRFVGWVK